MGTITHPATIAPAASKQIGCGGNETAEAFAVKGHTVTLASCGGPMTTSTSIRVVVPDEEITSDAVETGKRRSFGPALKLQVVKMIRERGLSVSRDRSGAGRQRGGPPVGAVRCRATGAGGYREAVDRRAAVYPEVGSGEPSSALGQWIAKKRWPSARVLK